MLTAADFGNPEQLELAADRIRAEFEHLHLPTLSAAITKHAIIDPYPEHPLDLATAHRLLHLEHNLQRILLATKKDSLLPLITFFLTTLQPVQQQAHRYAHTSISTYEFKAYLTLLHDEISLLLTTYETLHTKRERDLLADIDGDES